MLTAENVLDEVITSPYNQSYLLKEKFGELLKKVWFEGEEFNGKRPFGNSDWRDEIIDFLMEKYDMPFYVVEKIISEGVLHQFKK
jgi:hypothetical protein